MNEKCFAMRRQCSCGALTVKGCPGYQHCTFYKPIWMYQRDQSQINVKLSGLPLEVQQCIAEKYHHGQMPWKGERK